MATATGVWPSDIAALCRRYLREPESISETGGVSTFNFNPPLTAPETVTFNRIVALSKSLISGITATEWAAIEPDITILQTFATGTVASKTLADVVNATRAQSRILRALIKN